jgi:hypothetical protein
MLNLNPLGTNHAQKNTALLLLRVGLVGFPRDHYPASPLERWQLPTNSKSMDPKTTPVLLLQVCLNMFTEWLPSNGFFSGSIV